MSASVTIPSTLTFGGGTIDSIKGGTLDAIRVISGTLTTIGGTVTVTNDVTVKTASGTNLGVLVNNPTSSPAAVQLTSFSASVGGGIELKSHLSGLAVSTSVTAANISGFTSSLLVNSGLTTVGTSFAGFGIGVSFGRVNVGTVSLDSNSSIFVKGDVTTLNDTNPVGITFTGSLRGLTAVGISGSTGTVLGIGLYARGICGSIPVGISGDALKVAIEGVGICFGSGITISGLSFPSSIGISGGTLNSISILGGTFSVLNIGSISGGTINIGNTPGVTFGLVKVSNENGTSPLKVDITDNAGTSVVTTSGVKIVGVSGGQAVGVTWSGTPAFGVSGSVDVKPVSGNTGIGGMSGGGTTFNVVLTDLRGVPIGHGLSGSTAVFSGFPVFGVSGGTGLGVTFSRASLGSTADSFLNSLFYATTVSGGVTNTFLGVTFTGSFGFSGSLDLASGVRILGMTGACGGVGVYPMNNLGGLLGLSGATVVGFPIVGVPGATAVGITVGTVAIRPNAANTGAGGMSGQGTTFNVVLTNVYGVPIGHSLTGSTAVFSGFPVFGVSGATLLQTEITRIYGGATGFHTSGGTVDFLRISPVRGVDGEPGVTLNGKVFVVGDINSGVGVTFGGISVGTISNVVSVKTTSTDTVAVTGSNLGIRPSTSNTGAGGMSGGGTTFNVVLTNIAGIPIGYSGTTFQGFPVFGVSGATQMGVTFGAITFGSAGMGVTFGGITFTTTRTIISGSAFADGGGNLGIPVFGVAGTTAVRVSIEGGTVAGIFVADTPGITIRGVTTGIPVFGVSGATAIGVTFGAIQSTVNFPSGGITIGNIVGGTVAVSSVPSITVTSLPNVAVTSLPANLGTVKVSPADNMSGSNGMIVAQTVPGVVVTEKKGSQFAIGLTLGPFLLQTTNANQSGVVGVSGGTFFFFATTPRPVTRDYTGPGWTDAGSENNAEGNPFVPLRQGLYVQLTKSDLISHVLIGYTAGSLFEFERNAQVLTREYQMAPIWAHALDQFRRFPGFTGNVTSMSDKAGFPDFYAPDTWGYEQVQKQYIGVIEKPSRIFIPTFDAGKVYIMVKGDYQSHAIGSGFWDQESGQWSDTTLYERSYFAANAFGFSGSSANASPNLTPGGALTTNAQYDYERPGPSPVITAPSIPTVPRNLTSIIQGYVNNPFIRIWGY